ncbi:MAG: hypothetical protein ACR5KV_07310 [Wolbachia sp.]
MSNILERLPSISPLFGTPAIVTRVTGQTVCTSTTPTTQSACIAAGRTWNNGTCN